MKRLEDSLYHKLLRIFAAVLAVVLVFESGLLSDTTADLASTTHLYLAQSVGMSASVQPTDLNQVTAELSKQKQLLDAREAELREREIAVELQSGTTSNDTAVFLIAIMLFVLLVLIVTNYILDYWRSHPVGRKELTHPV